MCTFTTSRILAFTASLLLFSLLVLAPPGAVRADEGWTIDSYDVTYSIESSGIVQVVEDIRVDFGALEKHGIFRDMPVRYEYDEENDRLISPGNVTVDDGEGNPHRFELISNDINLRIKIGDPDVIVSGPQRYRISYILTGAMNSFSDHDEFYWNVTGDEWPVRIVDASATVQLPDGGEATDVDCFQGPRGSTERCTSQTAQSEAMFSTTRLLAEGEGFTIVVGLPFGLVDVGPPILVDEPKSDAEKFADLFELNPFTIFGSIGLGVLLLGAIVRLWWAEGRDRWLGDVFYLHDGNSGGVETTRPLLAHETVVVEYTPPDVGRKGRRLRPAELGVLLDERADTLDVSATIVDLAVRKHLQITEEKSGGFFGLFKKTDYKLDRLDGAVDDLLSYENQLKDAFFDDGDSVMLSSLKNKFYKDLAKVKKALYSQTMKNGFFARNPETTTTVVRVAGGVLAAAGAGLVYLLGILFGGGLLGIPVILAGILVFLIAPAMPRRTGKGRSMYKRALGFRKFMVAAETERQKFAENANIFHEYLPYAIIYGCVDRWASVFKELGIDPGEAYYYVGRGPFVATAFADSVSSFSSSISSTMASSPGSSGGSGFGGGGGSGGGGGGGGGGSW